MTIDAEKTMAYWAESADYDLETAKSLLRSKRYPDAKMEFYQKCTREFAKQKFAEIKKVYSWLLKKSKK